MLNPFVLAQRGVVAVVAATLYSLVFILQAAWYLAFRRPDKVGDAFGMWGQKLTEVATDLLRTR